MATAPVITSLTIIGDSWVQVNFTHSGASTEVFSLERTQTSYSDGTTVRVSTRGASTSFTDYTAAPADVNYAYRFRVTNADGSGAVYSNIVNITMVCKDFSSVNPMPASTATGELLMNAATSRNSTRGRDTKLTKFVGRQNPVAEKGTMRDRKVDISWVVFTWLEVERYYSLMVNSDFWYRDNSGRSFHAICDEIKVDDSQVLNKFTLSTTITQIDGDVTG